MKKLQWFLSVLILFELFVILSDINHPDIDISGVLTFFSIGVGFSVTALTYFGASKLSKDLYQRTDSSNGKTLLHSLMHEFDGFIHLSSAVIVIALFIQFGILVSMSWWINAITFAVLLTLSLNGLLAFVRVYSLFSKYLIKSISRDPPSR